MGNKFSSISIRLATPEDSHLPTFDNTKSVAIDTCIRWGVLTYVQHKTLNENVKAQALEAGTVLHQVFAAVRLWQLYWYDLNDILEHDRIKILNNQGTRLFKSAHNSKWNQLYTYFSNNDRDNLLGLCLAVLHTSDYEEDPDDKKRSMSTLEDVTINYVNRWDMTKYPIWVRDKNDPNTDVGIEIKYDLVITFEWDEVISPDGGVPEYTIQHVESYRFTGALDGLHIDPDAPNVDGTFGNLFVEDNKTASRIMDDQSKYDMDTQTRGYIIAARVFTGNDTINHAKVRLSSVPVPAKSPHGGMYVYPVYHEEHMITRWYDWFYNITQVTAQYQNDPIGAPVSPHSCMRYFRPCPMIPFCTASDEDQLEALETMQTKVWNVLADD